MYGDWMLQYPGTEYRFGPPGHPVRVVGWTFAGETYRTDDTELPRQDGIAFGEDFIEAGDLQVHVKIDYTSYPAPVEECARLAWEARSAFSRAWRADAVRSKAGDVAELTMGGEIAFEGRPRRIAWDDDAQNVGMIFGTATFVPAGTGVFDVSGGGGGWREETVGLVPALIGGLTAPLAAPLSTARQSSRARPFTVGGEVPAWPVVTIRGPLQSGAQFELTGRWRMPLNRSLRYNESVVIDTRPGHRSMRFNGRPANVLTSGAVQLAAASMEPGPNEIALRGTSLEGTATASVRWRDMKEST